MEGLGFRGFRVEGLGYKVKGLGFCRIDRARIHPPNAGPRIDPSLGSV